jgi:hypothetical protein
MMLRDYKLTNTENFILTLRSVAARLSINDVRALQLDSSITVIERVPIVINKPVATRIRRTG